MTIHNKQLITRGEPLSTAKRAMILIHGRGATAENILQIADELHTEGFALLAPQATAYTWYPYSFMAPVAQNEPSLSSALALLAELVEEVQQAGIAPADLFLLGFSQGACLSAEFAARHAQRYGGLLLFSGGLIGQELDPGNYQGDFAGAPVYLGCSDRDPHIPLHRVKETSRLLQGMGAQVNEQIFPGMPHTIVWEEIEAANLILKHPSPSL